MSQIHALIVEDNKTWQKIISNTLRRHDCVTDVANDYDEVDSLLDHNHYDMVTLDMALSSDEELLRNVKASSGWQLLAYRLTNDFPGTFIFVISASFEGQLEQIFEITNDYGVKGFMTKENFDPKILRQWVVEVTEFKKDGGRPDITTEELLDIYSNRTNREQKIKSLDHLKQLLRIEQRNLDEVEIRKAKRGIDVPVSLINEIEEYKRRIRDIEERIVVVTDELKLY